MSQEDVRIHLTRFERVEKRQQTWRRSPRTSSEIDFEVPLHNISQVSAGRFEKPDMSDAIKIETRRDIAAILFRDSELAVAGK